ncbi:hypothetical protein [Paucihalobacter sp.]|uniref:hypothetical protein n=1 Tax=Paucihalobacter sp. TaxID=2850405 RepID=UPI002FE333FE
MKKKLESELMSIAHRILKLKGKEDVVKLHAETAQLLEKLSVLKFAHDNFEGDIPTIGNDSSFFEMLDTAFNNKISDTIEREDKLYINLDDVEDDDIMEPVMEKIKDIVSQMPHEAQQIDAFFGNQHTRIKNDFEEITAGFEQMPEFEPVSSANEQHKKSLNDQLKSKALHIGLNDKIAFIKHLFDGKNGDYDRVVSQLNTSTSYVEAKSFIQTMVKPDYNYWKGKEDYEERFMLIVESKFN